MAWRPTLILPDGLVAVTAHALMRAKTTIVLYHDADRVARDVLPAQIPALTELPADTLRSFGFPISPGARS